MSNKRKVLWLIVVAAVFGFTLLWLMNVLPLPDCFRLPEPAIATADSSIKIKSDPSIFLEQEMRDWLNSTEGIGQAGLRCVEVTLHKEDFNKYSGMATFENGEQIQVSAEDKGDSYYFKAQPLVADLENRIKDRLNNDEEIRQTGLHCVSVGLKKDESDGYCGLATFNNGEKITVEVGTKGDSDELYFRYNTPSLIVVQSSVLPGYEYTTIGKAFNSFFADPNYVTRTSENGIKFVNFTGRLKSDLLLIELGDDPFANPLEVLLMARGQKPSWAWKKGDQIRICFAFSHDGEDFSLWSVQRGEDQPIRANDWQKCAMLDKLFEAIYEMK